MLARLIGAIEAALRAVFAATSRMMDADGVAAHRIVLEHIRLRDAAGASAAMHGLIDIAAADLAPLFTDSDAGKAAPQDQTENPMKITAVEPFILHVPLNRHVDLRFDPQHQPLGRGRREDHRRRRARRATASPAPMRISPRTG